MFSKLDFRKAMQQILVIDAPIRELEILYKEIRNQNKKTSVFFDLKKGN